MTPAKKKKPARPAPRNGGRTAAPRKRPVASEIAGILLFLAAIFLLLTLVTYHAGDPSWAQSAAAGQKVRNAGGRVGAWIAEAALQGFGLTAFLFPFLMGYLGFRAVKFGQDKHLPRKAGKFLLGTAILAPLLNLLFQSFSWHGARLQPGGFIGELLDEALTGLLNSTGALIVLIAAAVLFVGLATGISFKKVFLFVGRLFSFAQREVRIRITNGRKKTKTESGESPKAEKPVPALASGRSGAQEPPAPTRREIPKPAAKTAKPMPVRTEPSLFDIPEGYNFPLLTLLEAGTAPEKIDKNELLEKKRLIEEKLREFNIEGEVREYHPGPVITTYEFVPSPGIKISQVMNLAEDLSLALRAEAVRVQRLPGKSAIGVEIPNNKRETIRLRDVLASDDFQASSSKLTFALGKTVHDEVYVTDLTQMPHLLIAGATGTGKSVCLNTLIASILYKATPDEVKIVLIDPKQIEFTLYESVPHLLSPVIKDPKKAGYVLMDAVRRMEERLVMMGKHSVRNIQQYNQLMTKTRREKGAKISEEEKAALKPLPYIVIIIDELAELMLVSGQDVDYAISRLSQLARAVGIHLVLATQRPSADVITGTIKANFTTRIAFRVSHSIDSRIILDSTGAEKLLGKGDLLFIPPNNPQKIRLHAAFVSHHEIIRLVKFVREQAAPIYDERIADILESPSGPDWGEPGEKDARYEEAVRQVLTTKQASASYLQRRLKLGYARASRIIDQMEQEGLVGPGEGSKPREILVDPKEYLAGLDKAKKKSPNS